MREILFKAKAINRDKGYHRTSYKNGDWVYGLITKLYDEKFENIPAEMTDENGVSGIEIDHNTICQFTELTDKNGNKIWENDVVYIPYARLDDSYCKVIFRRGGFIGEMADGCEDSILNREAEVIGNIFDNPELLGERNG